MVREVRLSKDSLVYPVFIQEDIDQPIPIESMPGISRIPEEQVVKEAIQLKNLGIPAIILFGLPSEKDEQGSSAYDKNGIVQNSVKRIKDELNDELTVITDLCMCEYTSHGHCGILRDNQLINDETLEILGKIAVSQAESGADIVAPSGMIDGQVKVIRDSLDNQGYENISIMAYSAKYASAFYSPFREAVESAPQQGDRKSYQMDYSNSDESIREMKLDINEGADIIMVKPALAYLDLIYRSKKLFTHPIAAYNVSGEYSLVKAAVKNGWIDEKKTVLEILTGIKRAGADLIITYHAKDAALWL
jgi:porphobilinogen synthase